MQLSTNTRSFVEAEQYSDFILMNLHDGLLGESFYRSISDFTHGDTLHIKTIGTVTLQDASEDTPLIYNPIESGEITFTLTDYVGDAWYVTDDLREDGNQIDQLMAARGVESTRAIQEKFETTFFKAAAAPYFAASTGLPINGFAHYIVSNETNDIFSLDHLIMLRLAFDKANVPAEGRVGILDPVVEATLNKLVTITSTVTPFAENILRNGLASGQRFVGNLFGWDLLLSNRLFVGTGTQTDGTGSVTAGVFNMFMCVLDDQTRPVMGAWRRMPKVEGERNKDRARDEFVTRCRWGWGIQRMDTMAALVTSTTATE